VSTGCSFEFAPERLIIGIEIIFSPPGSRYRRRDGRGCGHGGFEGSDLDRYLLPLLGTPWQQLPNRKGFVKLSKIPR